MDEDYAKSNFTGCLSSHQEKKDRDGFTPQTLARISANMRVLSRLYMNISFTELGQFFGITKAQAESLVAEAVNTGAVNASLDQAEDLVEFHDQNNPVQQQLTFNSQIEALCVDVD